MIGIDPGSRIMGLGCVQQNPQGQVRCLAYQSLKLDARQSMPQRLLQIHQTLTHWMQHWKPQAISLEKVFLAENFKSSIVLGQVRGVVLLASAQHEVPLFEYSATQVKSTIVGVGRADKQQVQHMMGILLDLKPVPAADAADALALALCHLRQNPALLPNTKSSLLRAPGKNRHNWTQFYQERLSDKS